MEGYLLQMQPFSVNDGHGIRTTIFLAGCPLRCQWCSNPEGFDQKPKTAFYEKLCIGCGACVEACTKNIGIDLNKEESRSRCDGCGDCCVVCVKHARKRMVEKKSTEEIVAEIRKHRLFYLKSGGGVTFSGGEATMQAAFLDELSQALYDQGISLALETCGYFDFDTLKPVLQRMDLIFMDLKHMDSKKHIAFTGVDNQRILENIKRLAEIEAEIVIRIPVIKGVNADVENIRRSVAFVRQYLPRAKMELLPYHQFGEGKYEALGMSIPGGDFVRPSEEDIRKLEEIITKEKIDVINYK